MRKLEDYLKLFIIQIEDEVVGSVIMAAWRNVWEIGPNEQDSGLF